MRVTRFASPLRSTVPVRSPLKSPLRSTNLNKSVERTRTNVNLGSSTSNLYSLSYEEENFLNFLKDLLSVEAEYERSKCDLVLRSDFNVEDVFRIFELDGRGYLTDLDLKFGLNSLDIFPTSEEIALLLRRFDNLNEGVLSYASFFDLLAPVDREYRRMLENRLPSSYVSRYNKSDVFLPTTKLYLHNFFNLVLRSEARLEGWRQRLNKLPRFNLRSIFQKIDRLDRNSVNEVDVKFNEIYNFFLFIYFH
jgi:hypothetical protein